MKRNMDIIREILLHLEEHVYLESESLPSHTPQEMAYHLSLLKDAGLIAEDFYSSLFFNAPLIEGIRITWAGHEFLDASRNKILWVRAKKIALEKTGAISFEVLKAILIQLGKDAISTL